MKISREELDAWLRRADHARLVLRRATLELAELGERLLASRERRDGTGPR